MIDRQHGNIVFVCDNCGDGTDEFDSFNTAQSYIKPEGWSMSNASGEWVHYCPDCNGGVEQ